MKLFVGAKGLIHYRGKVLLVCESSGYQDGTQEGKWDVPGGRIKSDEPLLEGLVREIKEESGLEVTPGKVLGAYDGFPEIRNEVCHIIRVYFLCEATSDEVVLSSDHDKYDWVVPEAIGDKALVDDIGEVLEICRAYI